MEKSQVFSVIKNSIFVIVVALLLFMFYTRSLYAPVSSDIVGPMPTQSEEVYNVPEASLIGTTSVSDTAPAETTISAVLRVEVPITTSVSKPTTPAVTPTQPPNSGTSVQPSSPNTFTTTVVPKTSVTLNHQTSVHTAGGLSYITGKNFIPDAVITFTPVKGGSAITIKPTTHLVASTTRLDFVIPSSVVVGEYDVNVVQGGVSSGAKSIKVEAAKPFPVFAGKTAITANDSNRHLTDAVYNVYGLNLLQYTGGEEWDNACNNTGGNAITNADFNKYIASIPDGSVVVLDLEQSLGTFEKDIDHKLCVAKSIKAYSSANSKNIKIGFYGTLPEIGPSEPVYVYNEKHGLDNNADASAHQKLIDHSKAMEVILPYVDYLFPNLYMPSCGVLAWYDFAAKTLTRAQEYGKPVYPLYWPIYYNNGSPLITLTAVDWRLQLDIARAYADGVGVWVSGGQGITGSASTVSTDNKVWLGATQTFLSDSTKTAPAITSIAPTVIAVGSRGGIDVPESARTVSVFGRNLTGNTIYLDGNAYTAKLDVGAHAGTMLKFVLQNNTSTGTHNISFSKNGVTKEIKVVAAHEAPSVTTGQNISAITQVTEISLAGTNLDENSCIYSSAAIKIKPTLSTGAVEFQLPLNQRSGSNKMSVLDLLGSGWSNKVSFYSITKPVIRSTKLTVVRGGVLAIDASYVFGTVDKMQVLLDGTEILDTVTGTYSSNNSGDMHVEVKVPQTTVVGTHAVIVKVKVKKNSAGDLFTGPESVSESAVLKVTTSVSGSVVQSAVATVVAPSRGGFTTLVAQDEEPQHRVVDIL